MAPRIAVLSCLLLLVSAASARAEIGSTDYDFERSGWYLGAGFSVGFEAFSGIAEIEDFLDTNVTVGDSMGVNGRVGYRLFPWLAVEGQFEWFSSFNYTAENVVPPGEFEPRDAAFAGIEDYTLTANAKGYLLTGRLQPFGLIGVGGMLAKNTARFENDRTVDVGGFVARFGGGADYYLDENWILGLDVSYLVTTGNVGDTDRVSLDIGIQYRF